MAVCPQCDHEMKDGKSCVSVPFLLDDGEEREPTPNGDHQCGDCLTPAGGFHHPGCDMERCPKCGGQAISCGCLSADA